MIKREHIWTELKNAQNVVKNEELRAILKLIEVVLKVDVDTRSNTVKIMRKLGIDLDKKPQEQVIEE